MNERFEGYDALLYELVAEPGALPVTPGQPGGVLSGMQRLMTTMLDLTYQLDEIDYRADNFVHADLSPSELSASMTDRGESLYVYFWRVLYASFRDAGRDPLGLERHGRALAGDGGVSAKLMFARELARGDALMAAFGGADGSALISARNARAIEVLRQRIDGGDRRLGIFYGVAHMPDFHLRMIDLGYEQIERDWIDAWRLDSDDSGEAP